MFSSSRQPRCIPRGSPLDIVAPRRLVRISLLPCLFFFPFYRFSIARCLFPHLVAPISLAHRDALSLTDRIEPFIPSSRILGSITRVSPFRFPPSLPPCFVFVRSVHPVWSCSPQHIATVHSVETSTRYRYAALHPCVTGYLISPFLSLSPPLAHTHTHIHILSLFLSGFFFSRFVSLVPSEYSSFFLQSTGRCSLSFFLPSLFSFPPSLSLEGYPLCFDQTFFRLFVLASSRAGNRRLAPRDTLWLPRKTRDSFVASRKEGTRVVIEFPLFFSSSLSR